MLKKHLTDMKEQWQVGVSFGLTSGAITTMGLIVGLHSETHEKLAETGVASCLVIIGK